MRARLIQGLAGLAFLIPAPIWAQDDTAPAPESTETAAAEVPVAGEDGLLTDAELQTLVAPVALYPDTLLIQILVAATEPLEVIKSQQFLADNEGVDPAELKPEIEAQGWDASVEVLATGFPEVTAGMADHIEWTETLGNAMLAQDDDVMAAVQVMRQQAIDSGALLSGEEQTVETDDSGAVVIEPTDPEVVYVPQYTNEVYDSSLDDVLLAGAIGFGTYLLVDAIFDDDDDWNNYWGCRNCGGWNGRPIVRNPDIDIDVDGNVNIGNEIDRDKIEWKPDDKRRDEARDKISEKRDDKGATTMPINRPGSDKKADELRGKLSDKTGATDISRPSVNRPAKLTEGERKDAIAKTKAAAGDRPKANPVKKKPAAQKPAVQKKAAPKKQVQSHNGAALKKKAGGGKAHAASNRGKASAAKAKLNRR